MMTCEQIKSWMMDYIYEELSSEQKPLFEAHLSQCAACRAELAGLQQTAAVLAEWSEADAVAISPIRLNRPSWWQRLQESWLTQAPGWAAGLAVAAMLLLFLLAAFNTRISSTEGRWQIHMSLRAQPPAPALPEGAIVMTRQDLLDLEQRRWQAIQAYVAQSEVKQQKEMTQAISRLARAVQAQRTQDLQLVGKGFAVMGEETAQRFELTDQMLTQVLRLASSEPESMP